jgi:hypothetical protein
MEIFSIPGRLIVPRGSLCQCCSTFPFPMKMGGVDSTAG